MSDRKKKRWFEVSGYVTYGFTFEVLAGDAAEAQKLFWESDVDMETIVTHTEDLQVTWVNGGRAPRNADENASR